MLYNHHVQHYDRSKEMKSLVNEIHTKLPAVNEFKFAVNYAELDAYSEENVHESHVHDGCEIYINISGDVSFTVENHFYHVESGNIIITRPFEYHNCVYNNNELHKQFCIIFSTEGNEFLLDLFFNRKKGEGNLITLSKDNHQELIECCNMFLTKTLNDVEKYLLFMKIISLVSSGVSKDSPDLMPESVKLAIDYIIRNLSGQIKTEDLAAAAHVSVNTLERHFKEALGTSPANYLKNKRLANAARLLRVGKSVTDACFDSGFANCSHFISQFKSAFGVTPKKFQTKNK